MKVAAVQSSFIIRYPVVGYRILYFILVLMPTEPPALANSSGGADEREKTSIAKFITISYAKPPLIYLAVAGLSKVFLAISP
ncbi:uncharacterized protein L3040_003326 [Drepanopeziza brunnea f. sp. 'multigermtubi']|uniref:uncharacterized protein n=1 Tax=Drepanopeziza brunnea f. sp. 'multigermtubi' TaxID=698441 RepID=UPI0023942BE1|nr:hypothetical protein L3040_003326 [Drepanopeziza brunnea f. sp. 'multigermtubi']